MAKLHFPALLFHDQVISTPTRCIRFTTLRGFNLSHSKRRCQGQEQIQRGTWLVERRFSDMRRVVTKHSGVSYACLLVPVVRRSPRLRPPSQNVFAQVLCHILSCPHIHRPKQRSRHELGRNTTPCLQLTRNEVREAAARPSPLGDGRKDRVASKLVFQPLYSDNGQSLAQRAFQCSSRGVHIVSLVNRLLDKHVCPGRNPPTASRAVHVFGRTQGFTSVSRTSFAEVEDDGLRNFNVDEQLSLSVILALTCSANMIQSRPVDVQE